MAAAMTATCVVGTLVGHRQMEFAAPCLASLLRCCRDPIRLRVHDDGTLTAEDQAALRGALGAEVLTRAGADALVAGALAPFPATRAFRERNPLALKLVDVGLVGEDQEAIAYCDADILFLRPFAGLFVRRPERPLFMRDGQDAYSVRPWQLLRRPGLRLAGRLNSGIVVFPRAAWRLETIEAVLALPGLRPPVWAEQTCWAALAAAGGARLLDPRRFAIARPGLPDAETVAIHFVSPTRALMPAALAAAATGAADGGPAIVAASAPAPRATPLSLALDAVRRRLRRAARSARP